MDKTPFTLLIVDDEPNMLLVLEDALSALPYRLVTARSVDEGRRLLREEEPELVLCDLQLGDQSGMVLLEESRHLPMPPAFVFLTAHGDVQIAVEALKQGAFDFLVKPVPEERLLHTLRQAGERVRAELQISYMRSTLNASSGDTLIGNHASVCTLKEQLGRVAPTGLPVLILGESGTGKELVARAIHERSGRRAGPFVVVNCAVLSRDLAASELFGHEKGAFTGAQTKRRGKFELADAGTLFLDEIGELPLDLQPKLLRVLEDGIIERVGSESGFRVEVRVVAATNRDLAAEAAAGTFRLDLYHRLGAFVLTLPPLCERGDDVLLLSEHFLERCRTEFGRPGLEFGASALDALRSYRFPGNIRELRNVVERASVMAIGNRIESEHLLLPADLSGPETESHADDLQGHLRDEERTLIVKALERNGWVQARAARELGLNRSHLHYKMKRLGIAAPPSGG